MDFLRRLLGGSDQPRAPRGPGGRPSVSARRVVPATLDPSWPALPPRPRWPDELTSDERNALPFEDDRCPACQAVIVPLPKGTKRCRECGQQMYVRVIDRRARRLVTEADRDRLQQEEIERLTDAQESAEQGWYAALKTLGLQVNDDPDDGTSIDVVGESHYLEDLAGLMAALRQDPGDSEVWAIARMQPEPTNRYDRKAIRIEVHARHVGYLSREDAEDIKAWMRRASKAGPVWALARLGGGRLEEGRVGPIGVTLENLPDVFNG